MLNSVLSKKCIISFHPSFKLLPSCSCSCVFQLWHCDYELRKSAWGQRFNVHIPLRKPELVKLRIQQFFTRLARLSCWQTSSVWQKTDRPACHSSFHWLCFHCSEISRESLGDGEEMLSLAALVRQTSWTGAYLVSTFQFRYSEKLLGWEQVFSAVLLHHLYFLLYSFLISCRYWQITNVQKLTKKESFCCKLIRIPSDPVQLLIISFHLSE